MGFGMLGCQCCPSCEAIHPTSVGPDSGGFEDSPGAQNISNPAKTAFETRLNATIDVAPVDGDSHLLAMSSSPLMMNPPTISVLWIDVPPTAPYAAIYFSDGVTTFASYTDPTWPEGDWRITVTPTSASVATIDFVCGGFSTTTTAGVLYPSNPDGWCSMYGQVQDNDTPGGGFIDFTDWVTEVL